MNTEFVLETEKLKKHFGAVRAVEDVSLRVKRGEIFGFLGPNGSGKTTTISMILGLTHPNAGSVTVFGQRVTPANNRILRRVGTMVGAPSLLQSFSARQNLQCMACLRPDLPAKRIDEVLELVGLKEAAQRRVSKYSMGMRQRLGLALALVNTPDLLILDEPTNGMDPAGMHEVRTLLRSLSAQGVTVFLSSHLLHEMELICDRVAVIQRGHVIVQGSVADLLTTQEVVQVIIANPERAVEVLRALPNARVVRAKGFYVDVQGVSSEQVLAYLVAQGLMPKEVSVNRPDLESVFLDLTQKDESLSSSSH